MKPAAGGALYADSILGPQSSLIVVNVARESGGELAQLLGDLAIEMQAQTDTEHTLQAIVEGAVEIVPGATWAGISMIHGREIQSRGPSDPLVAELDRVQISLGEGPCLSALREHHTVLIDDMAAETRWPRFARAAVERGARSLLSFQLFVRRESLGALDLYSAEAGAFDHDSILVGEVFAQHASVALVGAENASRFQAALTTRDIIGQAKGILMYRDNLTGLQAFTALTRASQETNIKLVEVARWLVAEHEGRIETTGP
jgi:putative methionine-R-sulfoxide reductase with GAF domain